ncbi:LytTR family DNA-binding domain-containing protein [Bacteroides helcogenes]|uniref:Two component transcriptional regulator, LytTR family n=1 Tax=Bacteroides helcogenes (strain ATCC 35417 / DSM 20613 / JCM 6297 / CCUG 15421 / P 36-108) TaxID=693979 RepID=E6SR59_BACT6|nr:response regulator [Bacteroides helcogenes]ADV42063.1 two component transcriptional regulator, LytTR family [Bacteroides helcogenes P 36-108]MDY5240010.1 response regulator [Bacteroides helcogenes]
MEKYKVIIVDDDEISLENLGLELRRDVRFSLEGCARNGRQGKKLIAKTQPDLLFLDVEMPDMTGMDLLREMRESITWNMRIVFYTAYDKYMIQAIREAAFDYLLKPFEKQDLKDILMRFVKQAGSGQRTVFPAGTALNIGQTFIVFTPTNDMRALRPAEIGFFRYCSDRKQWEVILSNQPPLVLRRGMTAEQITSYSSCFVQIHQSYIINIDYLMLIKDNKCVLYPPFDKVTELIVSKKYKKELQDRFCL